MYQRLAGWLIVLILAVQAMSAPARAEAVQGRDYVPIVPAQPTDTPTKIEVLEFFSYGCPHCSDFHPIVSKWAAALPGDVVFNRVPVSFGRAQWASLGKLYYALEATGDLAKLDTAVFEALHKSGIRLYDDQSIIDWVKTKGGIDAKKFTDAYNSFGVVSKAKRAEQLVQAYKIDSVPAMTVDGKYLVVLKPPKGLPDLPLAADQVIDKVRGERKKK